MITCEVWHHCVVHTWIRQLLYLQYNQLRQHFLHDGVFKLCLEKSVFMWKNITWYWLSYYCFILQQMRMLSVSPVYGFYR